MRVVCRVCGNQFSSMSNLRKHQKTARYCIDISTVSCKYCPYQTHEKELLEEHYLVCKYKLFHDVETEELVDRADKLVMALADGQKKISKLKAELERAREEIIFLRSQVEELKVKNANSEGKITVYKERPGTVNNNQYVNKLLQVKCDTIRPFTIETVRDDVKQGKYTFERYIQAEKGLIEFISDMISQDDQRSYVCTDSSRQRFHRLLESREWKDDNGATFLNKVLDELKDVTITYYEKVADMMVEGDRELADLLMDKTRTMAMGIIKPKSKDREATFTKIRNEVKKLTTV